MNVMFETSDGKMHEGSFSDDNLELFVKSLDAIFDGIRARSTKKEDVASEIKRGLKRITLFATEDPHS